MHIEQHARCLMVVFFGLYSIVFKARAIKGIEHLMLLFQGHGMTTRKDLPYLLANFFLNPFDGIHLIDLKLLSESF